MDEPTTDDSLHVSGEPHRHPAFRRLARGCIALVRWHREQLAQASSAPYAPLADSDATEPAADDRRTRKAGDDE